MCGGKTAEIKGLLNTRKQPAEIIFIIGYKEATVYAQFRQFLMRRCPSYVPYLEAAFGLTSWLFSL